MGTQTIYLHVAPSSGRHTRTRTESDWIKTEANFGRTGLDRTAIFLKIGGSGLDRTEKMFVVLM